jgi:hypothetical protein
MACVAVRLAAGDGAAEKKVGVARREKIGFNAAVQMPADEIAQIPRQKMVINRIADKSSLRFRGVIAFLG